MIYLYVKTHRKTGLKYLGKTTQDPYAYQGSGIRWIKHIKKHGYDVDTEVLLETNNNNDIRQWGEHYSVLWNVVESDKWANLKPESGDGGDTSMTDAYIEGMKTRVVPSRKGIPRTKETCLNMSKAKMGIRPPNFEQWSTAWKDTYFLNNGIVEKRFAANEIPEGWNWGRLKTECICGKMVDKANKAKYHKDCVKIIKEEDVKT